MFAPNEQGMIADTQTKSKEDSKPMAEELRVTLSTMIGSDIRRHLTHELMQNQQQTFLVHFIISRCNHYYLIAVQDAIKFLSLVCLRWAAIFIWGFLSESKKKKKKHTWYLTWYNNITFVCLLIPRKSWRQDMKCQSWSEAKGGIHSLLHLFKGLYRRKNCLFTISPDIVVILSLSFQRECFILIKCCKWVFLSFHVHVTFILSEK